MTTTPCFGRHEFRATGTSKLAWNVQAREDSSKDSLSRLPTLSLAGFAKIWSSGGGGHLFSPQWRGERRGCMKEPAAGKIIHLFGGAVQ